MVGISMAGPSGPKSGDPDGPQIVPPAFESIMKEPSSARRQPANAHATLPSIWQRFLRMYLRWNGIRLE